MEENLGSKVSLPDFENWSECQADCLVSRRPPPEEMMALLPQDQRDRVEHVACDFLSKPGDIAKQLKEKNVTGDYIFFYSYAQPKPQPGNPVSSARHCLDISVLVDNHIRPGLTQRSSRIRTVGHQASKHDLKNR